MASGLCVLMPLAHEESVAKAKLCKDKVTRTPCNGVEGAGFHYV